MKLQQLRYIREVARQQLNVSQAAQALFTSQPGISKQIRQLEDELGVEIFTRNGKHLTHITAAGESILSSADEIITRIENIEAIAQEHSSRDVGQLAIATTHTQCRYVLPPVIRQFIGKYPDVALHMHQGTPAQIAALAAAGTTDCAIATEALASHSDLIMMPCYSWNRTILVPKFHVLAQEDEVTIEKLSRFPLVTYTAGFTGRSRLDEAFATRGLSPNLVLTAADADVIKTYVRLGLGVGIVARMAWDPVLDEDLVALDASHLFAASITSIGFRKGSYLRSYMYDFMRMFAPHLERELVQKASACQSRVELESLFRGIPLPQL